jgi:hypothetical protein
MPVRFVYVGPPDEPDVAGTFSALSGEWVRGVPRDIDDPDVAARLGKHPHWRLVDDEAHEDEPAGVVEVAPAAPRRRGRPSKVRDDGDA